MTLSDGEEKKVINTMLRWGTSILTNNILQLVGKKYLLESDMFTQGWGLLVVGWPL